MKFTKVEKHTHSHGHTHEHPHTHKPGHPPSDHEREFYAHSHERKPKAK
jgi:hypothetical protein